MKRAAEMLSQSAYKSITGKFIADVSMDRLSILGLPAGSWEDDAPYSFSGPKLSPFNASEMIC